MLAHLDFSSLTFHISMSHLNIVMQNLTRASLSTTHLSHPRWLDDVITYEYTITTVAQVYRDYLLP